MNKTILILLTLITILSCEKEKTTEIILIGTLHNPEPNFNSEILFDILEDIKPDLILLEGDSSFFTTDFRLKKALNSNETMASTKYAEKYPMTKLRPYGFEGRIQHRINIGSRPTDGLTTKLLDSLNKANLLSASEANIFNKWQALIEPLKVLASKSPENFNNPTTDSICAERQYYQYKMLTKITNTRDEFANRFHTKPNGQKISYRDGYQLADEFWDLRNQTMAKNIMRMAELNKGKRIIVTNGFMHRYYLIKELKRLTKGKNIILKEFYEK
ncbi:hypothetical protein IWQ47_001950 [Aquimarina sp. EL_43]|uniref:hypothetical protein n=1 Tax=unclassified Aquimarina TaxID=2627091 RepID=UPI000D65E455|nr:MULTISPECIES: hypothetical protein [unclassified Aquimarina]MBG6129967.1 hypothetical protein [Aquimarina sp. EL_35]MBG6148747.1 hypothetical protein [Aquimarina sp. EL_32]MBG6168879.1 hypothetical protein [Aquimarina sp. EL_43]